MTRLWLLLLFSLLTLNLHGQKLKGSVVDSEDKSAIVSANIIVLDLDSTFHKGQTFIKDKKVTLKESLSWRYSLIPSM